MSSELVKTNEEYICVVGDSFAGNRLGMAKEYGQTYDWSWVRLLEDNNNGKLIGKSFPGQSYFHQRRWFMQNMLDHHQAASTVLIFVHTHHTRLPHILDVPVTGQVFAADKNDPGTNELYKQDPSGSLFDLVRTFYTSNLYVDDFYQHALIAWLKEIAELTVYFKKVIHLFAFDNGFSNLPNRSNRFYLETLAVGNSIVVDTTLVSLVAAERGNLRFGGPDMNPGVQNHLNKHNNQELCKFIQYLMNEGTTGKIYSLPLDYFDLKDRSLIENIKPHRGGNFDPLYLIPGKPAL
jgi:hypothetical protein